MIIEDDAGEELERIDLAPLSTDEIHELVQSKGFVRQEQEPDAGAAEALEAQAEAVADAESLMGSSKQSPEAIEHPKSLV